MGSVLAQDQSNLFWDNANKRLGIGTMSPQNGITVSKSSTGAVRVDAMNTNTASTAKAFLTVSVAGAGAGDPVLIYDVAGASNWAAGVDNSDADKFKIASSAFLGTDDRLTLTTDGNVGVNVSAPSARLHLPAGSGDAGTAPLKLTAGALTTVAEDGAIEWDGFNLYRTDYTARRPLGTSLEVVKVMDFGAKGDGLTDDAPAFQVAVESLVETGGVVWVPPGKVYGLGSMVTIQSQYPIWIVSRMGGWGNYHVSNHGCIRPIAAIDGTADAMFKWVKAGSQVDSAGGGGVIGLTIMEPPGSERRNAIHSAIRLENGGSSD